MFFNVICSGERFGGEFLVFMLSVDHRDVSSRPCRMFVQTNIGLQNKPDKISPKNSRKPLLWYKKSRISKTHNFSSTISISRHEWVKGNFKWALKVNWINFRNTQKILSRESSKSVIIKFLVIYLENWAFEGMPSLVVFEAF